MEKVIEELKKYKDFFGVEEKEFDTIKKLGIEGLSKLTDESCRLTPLLEKISSYGLIHEVLPNLIGEYMKINDDDLKSGTNSVIEVMQWCGILMGELVDCECKHPSVQVYSALVSGSDLYDNIMDGITETHADLDTNFKRYFGDALAEFDNRVKNRVDSKYLSTIEELKAVKDPKINIDRMSECAKKTAIYLLLLKSVNKVVKGSNVIFIRHKEEEPEIIGEEDLHNDDHVEPKPTDLSLILSEMVQAANMLVGNYTEKYKDKIDDMIENYDDNESNEDFYEYDEYDDNEEYDLFDEDDEVYDNDDEYDDETRSQGWTSADEMYMKFTGVINAYREYKNCQYQYIKNFGREAQMLNRCNKDVK